jgi:hypothetical protein
MDAMDAMDLMGAMDSRECGRGDDTRLDTARPPRPWVGEAGARKSGSGGEDYFAGALVLRSLALMRAALPVRSRR